MSGTDGRSSHTHTHTHTHVINRLKQLNCVSCFILFLTDSNTLFPCIFRQIETYYFLVFSTNSNNLFPCIFQQIETPCFLVFSTVWNILFPCIFGRFKHLVSLHFQQIETYYFLVFSADLNTLFCFIFRQIQPPCFRWFMSTVCTHRCDRDKLVVGSYCGSTECVFNHTRLREGYGQIHTRFFFSRSSYSSQISHHVIEDGGGQGGGERRRGRGRGQGEGWRHI